jgi:hypothetical protein
LNPTSHHRQRYVRLNPKLTEDPPALDEVDKMIHIQGIVRSQMMNDDRIRQVALQLTATSFYFEKTGQLEPMPDGGFEVKG